MLTRVVSCFALALLLAAGGCSVRNIEVHGANGAGIKETVPPVMAMMFNDACAGVELPAAAIAPGDYVAVYHLSSGKNQDQWWTYLAEDALVAKVRAAGATPVERNDATAALLAAEASYVPPPRNGNTRAAADVPASARDAKPTPYRATRGLAYRLVAADVAFDRADKRATAVYGEPTVRVNAAVVINLRTLDANTGEVMWSGTVSGKAARDIPISQLAPWFPAALDWEDEDWEDNHGPAMFMWQDGSESVYLGPAVPPETTAP